MSLTLDEIEFSYPGSSSPVLDGVSVEIADGEAVALMGPSGRGKSTLLSIAGLLLRPHSGRVLIDGAEVLHHHMQLYLGSHISWVLQSTNLLPRRSIIDNVTLPAIIQGWSRGAAESSALEILQSVGLSLDFRRQARELSGGEMQRVGVARALITSPRVLLADEPTANLDVASSGLVCDALFARRDGAALLVATHDAAVAARADRIIRL